jgi:hypothetical protein
MQSKVERLIEEQSNAERRREENKIKDTKQKEERRR